MHNDKESFNRMVLLTGARIFGVVFSFIIPMYLGRHLSVEAYGTYKQVMLIYWFSQVALNLGFDDSVFYFFRWNRREFPLYSFNSLIFNLSVTGFLWILLSAFKSEISIVLNNPDLAQHLPILGYLILATLSSLQIEGFLINLGKFRARVYLDTGTELLKSLAILGAFLFFDSTYLALVFLSILMTIRLIWTISVMHEHKVSEKLRYRDGLRYFKIQAKFGLPLGASRIIHNILNMENLLVSSFYSINQFTYYAVGCFENPLINAAKTSLIELVNIDLIENIRQGDYEKTLDTWRRMTRKLLLIVIPFVVYMIIFSKEIITFIFSDKYLASVPFFMVFNLYVVIASLNPEPLFRATSKTTVDLKIKSMGVGLGVVLILIGVYWIGPMGALLGKMIAVSIMNITGLCIGATLIKSNILKLFQWMELGKTFLTAVLLTAVLRFIFWDFHWHPFWVLAFSFSLYLGLMFVVSYKINLIKEDEVMYLKLVLKNGFEKLVKAKNR